MKFLCALCLTVLFIAAPAQAESAFFADMCVQQASFGAPTKTAATPSHPSATPRPEKPETEVNEDAQSEYLYCQSKGVIQGNIGTVIGLGVALIGLLQFTIQAKTSGLLVLLAGVFVTLSPSVYISFMKGLRTTFSGVEGGEIAPPSCGGSSKAPGKPRSSTPAGSSKTPPKKGGGGASGAPSFGCSQSSGGSGSSGGGSSEGGIWV